MYRVFLVRDKNTKEFVKKYSWSGYSGSDKLRWERFFTVILGRARIFDTKNRAKTFMEGCTNLTKYLHADLEVVSYWCTPES